MDRQRRECNDHDHGGHLRLALAWQHCRKRNRANDRRQPLCNPLPILRVRGRLWCGCIHSVRRDQQYIGFERLSPSRGLRWQQRHVQPQRRPVSAYYEYVGVYGTGNFVQSGGANRPGSNFYLGDYAGSSGIYSLSGNGQVLAPDWEYLGYSGTAIFTQSGGTHNVGAALALAYNAGSSGTYSLRGSGLLATYSEFVGWNGTSIFTQSGGTNSPSFLYLGFMPGSSGTYNLNGGLLVVWSLSPGSGTAAFNFNGGTLQASGSFSTTLPMTLGTSGGGAAFDTAGYAVTLSGSLSGPGSLTKVDSGTLTLSASNSYTGDTIVDNGKLIIDYPDLATRVEHVGR